MLLFHSQPPKAKAQPKVVLTDVKIKQIFFSFITLNYTLQIHYKILYFYNVKYFSYYRPNSKIYAPNPL